MPKNLMTLTRRLGSTGAVVIGLFSVGVLAACSSAPADPSAPARVIREPAETQTGSNLPRRGDKRNTAVVEADKDAIGSATRSATRNSGQ